MFLYNRQRKEKDSMEKFSEIIVMDWKRVWEYVYLQSGDPSHKKYAIISIQEPTGGYGFGVKFQKGGNCQAALNIEFSDCTPAIKMEESVLINKEQAQKIHDFIEEMPKEVEQLIVQCKKGKSRSAAVAAAILFIKTGNNKQIFDNKDYSPNMYVYYKILETYGFQNLYWEECYQNEKAMLESLKIPEKISKIISDVMPEISK